MMSNRACRAIFKVINPVIYILLAFTLMLLASKYANSADAVCYPKALNEIRVSIEPTVAVAAWYCDRPRGFIMYWRAGNPKAIIPAFDWSILGKANTEVRAIDSAVFIRATTPEEDAAANRLNASDGIKAVVINPGYPDAPSYARNENGTRGPKTDKRITVGSECHWGMRLVAIDANGVEVGTDYYAVVGETGLYSRCRLSGVVSK